MATNVTPQNVQNITSHPRQSWWASLLILCAVLGALLGLSFKARDVIRRQDVPADNYAGLVPAYRDLKLKLADSERTVIALNTRVSKLEKDTASRTSGTQALLDDLNQTKFQAGLTGAVGPGIIVTLDDSKKPMPIGYSLPPGMAPPNIIHDTDINQIVTELKIAGAEAIAVNDQRLIADSSVRCVGPVVQVNEIAQSPPYVIRAIGNPKTLPNSLSIPGGVADQMRSFDPAMLRVQTVARIVVPASPGPPPPKFAKPLLSPSAEGDARMAATP